MDLDTELPGTEYLGAPRAMLLCVTLCPLINYVKKKSVKIMAVKGLTIRWKMRLASSNLLSTMDVGLFRNEY